MVKYIYIILIILLLILSFIQYDNIVEYFKPNIILEATNNEDLGLKIIKLREDNSFDYLYISFLGFETIKTGNFLIEDNILKLNSNERLTSNTYTISPRMLFYINEFDHIHNYEIKYKDENYFNDILFDE